MRSKQLKGRSRGRMGRLKRRVVETVKRTLLLPNKWRSKQRPSTRTLRSLSNLIRKLAKFHKKMVEDSPTIITKVDTRTRSSETSVQMENSEPKQTFIRSLLTTLLSRRLSRQSGASTSGRMGTVPSWSSVSSLTQTKS